jgi:hypothetical protein
MIKSANTRLGAISNQGASRREEAERLMRARS